MNTRKRKKFTMSDGIFSNQEIIPSTETRNTCIAEPCEASFARIRCRTETQAHLKMLLKFLKVNQMLYLTITPAWKEELLKRILCYPEEVGDHDVKNRRRHYIVVLLTILSTPKGSSARSQRAGKNKAVFPARSSLYLPTTLMHGTGYPQVDVLNVLHTCRRGLCD